MSDINPDEVSIGEVEINFLEKANDHWKAPKKLFTVNQRALNSWVLPEQNTKIKIGDKQYSVVFIEREYTYPNYSMYTGATQTDVKVNIYLNLEE